MSTPTSGTPWTGGGTDDFTAAIQAANAAATASFSVFVLHGSNASYARPDVDTPLIWIGTVDPTNAQTNDVVFTTS